MAKHNARLAAVNSLKKFLAKSEADRFKIQDGAVPMPKPEPDNDEMTEEATQALQGLANGE